MILLVCNHCILNINNITYDMTLLVCNRCILDINNLTYNDSIGP